MAITKTFIEIELADGSEHTLRALLVDKRLASRTAHVHKWDIDGKDSLEFSACLAYSAAKREGLTESTYEEFRDNELVDIFVTNDEPDDDSEGPVPF